MVLSFLQLNEIWCPGYVILAGEKKAWVYTCTDSGKRFLCFEINIIWYGMAADLLKPLHHRVRTGYDVMTTFFSSQTFGLQSKALPWSSRVWGWCRTSVIEACKFEMTRSTGQELVTDFVLRGDPVFQLATDWLWKWLIDLTWSRSESWSSFRIAKFPVCTYVYSKIIGLKSNIRLFV